MNYIKIKADNSVLLVHMEKPLHPLFFPLISIVFFFFSGGLGTHLEGAFSTPKTTSIEFQNNKHQENL